MGVKERSGRRKRLVSDLVEVVDVRRGGKEL